jgi:glycoprotein-N-acetylgalactosamine 3-beta-galactosyltransferase/transcription initiation factor TFIID subunit 7
LSLASIRAQLDVLHQQLGDLRSRRQQQELEIANIENYALRKRFQDILDKLLVEQLEKEQEVSPDFIQT